MSKNNHSCGSAAVHGEPVEPSVRPEPVVVRQAHHAREEGQAQHERDEGHAHGREERQAHHARGIRKWFYPSVRPEPVEGRFALGVLALFLALASQTAFAQLTGNPAGLSPDTPGIEAAKPANDATNTQDKLFVRQIAIGNRAEVELGKLAQSKGSATGVKDFASRMQKDHSTSLDRAMKAGRPAKMDIPKDLDAEHKRVRDELNALSGADFDKAYLTAQMQDHQKTANLLLWHLSYGQNADLLKYSATTLPDVLDHLEHAKREYAKLTETPPPR